MVDEGTNVLNVSNISDHLPLSAAVVERVEPSPAVRAVTQVQPNCPPVQTKIKKAIDVINVREKYFKNVKNAFLSPK